MNIVRKKYQQSYDNTRCNNYQPQRNLGIEKSSNGIYTINISCHSDISFYLDEDLLNNFKMTGKIKNSFLFVILWYG